MITTASRAVVAAATGLALCAAVAGCVAPPTRTLPFNDPTPTASTSAGASPTPDTKVVQKIPGYSTGTLDAADFDAFWIDVDGGRRVECIRYSGDREGGLSCDWNHPQPINGPATSPAK